MIARLITARGTGNQIPPKKPVVAIAAGSTKFTPSPLWAEPREPELRFLRRTKLSSPSAHPPARRRRHRRRRRRLN